MCGRTRNPYLNMSYRVWWLSGLMAPKGRAVLFLLQVLYIPSQRLIKHVVALVAIITIVISSGVLVVNT